MNELIKDSNSKDILKTQLKNIILWAYIEIFFQFWEVISVIFFALSLTPILSPNLNNMIPFGISMTFIIIFICVVAGIFSYLNQLIIKLPIGQLEIRKLQFINFTTCMGNIFIIFGFIPIFILVSNVKELMKQEKTKTPN